MLQLAFFLLHHELDLDALFRLTEQSMIVELMRHAGAAPAGELLECIFGPRRRLYKRLGQYSYFQHRDLYHQLARRPYPWLAACGEELAHLASKHLGRRIAPHEILIDAPPPQLEVEFKVDIFFAKERVYRKLEDVSPVVQTLALKQFDDFVKRVRVFAAPQIADALATTPVDDLLAKAAAITDGVG